MPKYACGQHIYRSRRMCSSGVEVCDLEFKRTNISPRHIPHFVTRVTWHLQNPSTLLNWVCSDLHGQFLLQHRPLRRQCYRTWRCDRRRLSHDQVADVVLLLTPTLQKENRPRPTGHCAWREALPLSVATIPNMHKERGKERLPPRQPG